MSSSLWFQIHYDEFERFLEKGMIILSMERSSCIMTCFDSTLNFQTTNRNSHGRVLAIFSFLFTMGGRRGGPFPLLQDPALKEPKWHKVWGWSRLIAGNWIDGAVLLVGCHFPTSSWVINRTDHSLDNLVKFYPVIGRHESTMGPNEFVSFHRRSLAVRCKHQAMNTACLPPSRHGRLSWRRQEQTGKDRILMKTR